MTVAWADPIGLVKSPCLSEILHISLTSKALFTTSKAKMVFSATFSGYCEQSEQSKIDSVRLTPEGPESHPLPPLDDVGNFYSMYRETACSVLNAYIFMYY